MVPAMKNVLGVVMGSSIVGHLVGSVVNLLRCVALIDADAFQHEVFQLGSRASQRLAHSAQKGIVAWVRGIHEPALVVPCQQIGLLNRLSVENRYGVDQLRHVTGLSQDHPD